ncbi:hypothetical protein BDR05DRAFT_964557 [Suillus weaverae]|nr:hypothetical protein BDR05DRAFT_964557 [Suillus weaverae]
MTFLYLYVRYVGILFSAINVLTLPSISLTDVRCTVLNIAIYWLQIVFDTMLGVIVFARLHAMHQHSRKILIVLVVSFLPYVMCLLVSAVLQSTKISWEEIVLSGTYLCGPEGYNPILPPVSWTLGVVWEVIALCLAVRIVIIDFRELRRVSTRRSIGEVLMKTHVFYFTGYAAASFITLGVLSPTIADSSPVGIAIYYGVLTVVEFVQKFVLGPHLILSVRAYKTELEANSEAGTAMIAMAFHEPVHVTTGSGV